MSDRVDDTLAFAVGLTAEASAVASSIVGVA